MSSLKSRVEESICTFLKGIPGFRDLNIEPGHGDGEPNLPLMVVYAYDESPHEEMPSNTGIKDVQLRVYIEASSKETPRATLDGWIGLMDETFIKVTDIQAGCNKISEPDTRKVKRVHIYDITPNGSPDDTEDERWIEEREFIVLASPEDAF